ncbi:MAG: hypothetical protein JOZ10_00725 [Acidobacteria bacterium]|nr:hypothetical protein [Acidobacteriota bacterium]
MKAPYAELARANLRLARLKYGTALSPNLKASLQALTRQFGFSLDLGEILLLDRSWYVTHSGLLRGHSCAADGELLCAGGEQMGISRHRV